MPNFKGEKSIILQPGTKNVTYTFDFYAASSSTANDGFRPFGTTVSGVTVVAYQDDTAIDDLVNSITNDTELGYVTMSYPTVTMAIQTEADFKLTFVVGCNDGTELEADFGRVKAIDL